jgi:phage tail sheath protein FI
MYLHPGVYIEEIPSGSRPIEAASTSTALIVGYATKGPVGTPTLLFSFDQYVTQFGGIMDFHNPPIGFPAVDYMGHTVRAFFDNGGSKAYITRLVDGTTKVPVAASTKLVVPLGTTPTPPNIKYLHIQAVNPGAWADGLQFQAKPTGATPVRYTLSIGWLDRQNNLVASEVFTDVSFDPADAVDFVGTQVNGVSTLIKIDPLSLSDVPDAQKTPLMIGSLTSGDLSTLTDFAGLDTKTFKVKVDPGNAADEVTVTLAAPTTLAEVASLIEAQVHQAATGADSTVDPRVNFTCKVENNRLVLRSGPLGTAALGAVAAVTVTAGTPANTDGAATLKLLADATKRTGQQAFEQAVIATLSNTLPAVLGGGEDGGLPGSTDYDLIMPPLKKLRDISIILLPGQTWKKNAPGQDIISKFVGHAELMKNRMVIIDPADGPPFFDSSASFLDQGLPSSTYTATYYPWLEVANPYYHAELRPDRKRTVFIPPSGFAAGVWARTDGRRGVWKAPAGLQATLNGAANTKVKIGDDEQDQFNPVGLNCFRRIISDIVIWGSRTLATKSDPEWRYVPVRRTAMMLEESIYQGIQWAVFEPNDHRLWSSLRLNIGGFMDTLFRAGAFQGEKASDAYFVRCGLGDTMTQAEIDAGQVIVVVGFAPLKPAEFVIVRIQQIVGKQ